MKPSIKRQDTTPATARSHHVFRSPRSCSTGCPGNPSGGLLPATILAPNAEVLAGLRAARLNSAGVHRLSPLDSRLRLRQGWLEVEKRPQAALAGRLGKAQGPVLLTCLGEDGPIADTAEAYLKLHLLSHRLCLPNSLNLDGIFAALPTVAWTSEGAIALQEVEDRQLSARLLGRTLKVFAVDKFPHHDGLRRALGGTDWRWQPHSPGCLPRRGHHSHA